MPDQAPVTDQDRRDAIKWAKAVGNPLGFDPWHTAARVILAPADLYALADRVEAVVQERDKAQQDAVDAWEHAAQTDRDHVRQKGLWEQDYARVSKERDEARALDAAGHLMLDLPEPDVITPRTETNPAPIGLWNTDHPSVTGSPSNPPVVFVDENTDLPPTEARAYAYAILAAADYAERNQE